MKLAIGLVLLLTLCYAANNNRNNRKVDNLGTYSWYNCGEDTGTYINSITITPDPIVIPGLVHISVNATYLQTITVPTTMAVLLDRYSQNDSAWETIPCFGRIGSCIYDDVCSTLDYFFPYYQCPQAVLDSGLNCTCPIPPGTYVINDWVLPLLIPLPGEFLPGDYYSRITWNQDGYELLCLELYTTLEIE